MKACAANPSCTGLTKIAAKKYKLNSGTVVKANSKYTLYPKGGLTTTKYRIVYASKYSLSYLQSSNQVLYVRNGLISSLSSTTRI